MRRYAYVDCGDSEEKSEAVAWGPGTPMWHTVQKNTRNKRL